MSQLHSKLKSRGIELQTESHTTTRIKAPSHDYEALRAASWGSWNSENIDKYILHVAQEM